MRWLTPDRLTALEAVVGLGLMVAAVWLALGPAAAMGVAGALLFAVAIWPVVRRR